MAELRGGERAPSFRLPDDEGSHVASEDLSGQRVVLYFFPKADTAG